jgi:hypothetical protein
MHVSVTLAQFQFFLFISIIRGAAGRRRPTLILRKAEMLKSGREGRREQRNETGVLGNGTEKRRTSKEKFYQRKAIIRVLYLMLQSKHLKKSYAPRSGGGSVSEQSISMPSNERTTRKPSLDKSSKSNVCLHVVTCVFSMPIDTLDFAPRDRKSCPNCTAIDPGSKVESAPVSTKPYVTKLAPVLGLRNRMGR